MAFFCFHFGLFMMAHLVFIVVIFFSNVFGSSPASLTVPTVPGLAKNLWVPSLFLFASHGFSFFANFIGKKEHQTTPMAKLFFSPYGRIVIMHVTILVGGSVALFLGTPQPALVLLVVLKIATDAVMHARSHSPDSEPSRWEWGNAEEAD